MMGLGQLNATNLNSVDWTRNACAMPNPFPPSELVVDHPEPHDSFQPSSWVSHRNPYLDSDRRVISRTNNPTEQFFYDNAWRSHDGSLL